MEAEFLEAYPEPYQTSKMESLGILAKNFILDVSQGSIYEQGAKEEQNMIKVLILTEQF